MPREPLILSAHCAVHGTVAAGFEPVAEAFAANFAPRRRTARTALGATLPA